MKKKKILLLAFVFIISLFVFTGNVYAKNCSAIPDVEIDDSIQKVVSMVILVIQIAVPILLVVMGSIDMAKGIMANKEDEIAAGRKIFIKRLISGALVFFVIAIVKLIISAVSTNNNGIMSCADCFFNGPTSGNCQ